MSSSKSIDQTQSHVDTPHVLTSDGEQIGSPLGRSLSVVLTKEQFEKLYLQPSIKSSSQAANLKTFGNPTIIGIICFLLSFTPTSCLLMGWRGASATSAFALIGSYYLLSGIGLFTAGVLEWFLGNSLPSVIFVTFGAFWWSFAVINDPNFGIGTALSQNPEIYAPAVGFYLLFWGLYCYVCTVAVIKTNIAFVYIMFTVASTFILLSASYFCLGASFANAAARLQVAGGAMGFTCCMGGWYLFTHLALAAGELPFNIPVGDLSHYWK